jgi:hypothetical protein
VYRLACKCQYLGKNIVSRWRHLSASLYGAKTQNNNIILTAVKTSNITWWTLYGEATKTEDGDSMFLRNVGIYQLVYTAPKPRRISSTSRHYIRIQMNRLEENNEKTVRVAGSLKRVV